MNGGFRVRPDGQFVAKSLNSGKAQKGIQEPGKTNEALGTGAQTNQSAGASPLPSISLPKGGGAIRGMGEKFAANPVTGTGSLSVPIPTSPGRSGFGPQLSLSYDSGFGNGPFGFGWSLSLPSITRKTDKGLPKYQDAIKSDVFILSGAEDLVPVPVENPDTSRTINDETYSIDLYRPRIEGLFARIERWTCDDGDVHWRSISKDNILTVYGRDKKSRIFDPEDESRIFSWLICESYDDKGNAILYDYEPENNEGFDLSQVNECNRQRTAARYLKRIKYGNRKPMLLDTTVLGFRGSHTMQPDFASANWMFEVVFDYDEGHYEDLPMDNTRSEAEQHLLVQASASAGGKWSCRPDPFSAYRSGFEVRTYRRCQRVLMYHHFPELGSEPCLVRSTEFDYSDLDYSQPVVVETELEHKGSTRFASFIRSVIQSGYVHDETQPVLELNGVKCLTYLKKSLPPLEFEYSQATIQKEIKEMDAGSLENLPYGLDGARYQWVDLDGEGLSGILTEQAGTWFYKHNTGDGKFGAMEIVATKPSLASLNSGGMQLLDLAGDGQLDVVELGGTISGFYERTHDQKWENFIPFTTLPNLFWKDPNLKFVDLTGDGHADIMITEDEVFTWYPSLAEEGFGSSEMVRQALDEEKGPRLVFDDGTQSIYLADFSGDGLTDMVRIRNGEVCYWPNLGYGRFGAKVTMDNSPWFDYLDMFDQKRIRLADIDGSGTTDIIYLENDGASIYFNHSGNSWSGVRKLVSFPHIDNLSSVQVSDLKGNGTACLVWSSPLPCDSGRPMLYIDLMGGKKPHLMVNSKNNMGAETVVNYVASTKFYLDDKAKGKPWITRIPFPVHVVESVETHDHISQNRFVTRYAYHHGYFDGIEREFRGFGMVEQWDTGEFVVLSKSDEFPSATNIDEASHVPPVLTKTWFHTGAYLEDGIISKQFEEEYYHEGDPSLREGELSDLQLEAMLLPDTVLPDDLSAEEAREACRSLKGSILRQEVYALDRQQDGKPAEESDRPYTVSERNYIMKRLQTRGDNQHAVFFVHPRETIDFHYERKLFKVKGNEIAYPDISSSEVKTAADPRVTHSLTLEVDEYGNVCKSVAVGYGRRFKDPDLSEDDQKKQEDILITYNENSYTEAVIMEDAYRAPLPFEARTFEILKFKTPSAPAGVTALFRFKYLNELAESADFSNGKWDIPYEDILHAKAEDDHEYRRLIEHVRTVYRSNYLSELLAPEKLHSLALPGESYKLAFTPDLIDNVYQRKRTGPDRENLLPDPPAVLESKDADGGGYINLDGNWWVPSGRVFYWQDITNDPVQELDFARKHFFLPHRFSDPFGKDTYISYDISETDPLRNHNLLLIETHDHLDNIVSTQNDYRVLQPYIVTDPNDNRSQVIFDALGMVAAVGVIGKKIEPDGKPKGDLLEGFQPDLTQTQIDDFMAQPRVQGADPSESAAAQIMHDRLGKATSRIIYDIGRFKRTGEPPFAATIARETHTFDLQEGQRSKLQVSFSYSDGFEREIQKKIQAEPGPIEGVSDHVSPRWVGSGWTIFNNKGKPVRQYEPFFDDTHKFKFGKKVGVSSVLFYDPVERVIATLHPNNSFEKVVFDPWHQKTYDVNDTVTMDPRTDADISGYLTGYFATQLSPWETWYQQRIGLPAGDSEQTAAEKTALHNDTPAIVYLDTLGRPFLTVAHNKFERGTNGSVAIIEEKYRTRVVLDIEGNQREVRDERMNKGLPEERIMMHYDYDILGNRIKQVSMEAGTRWLLNNVAGKTIRTWDSRGFQRRMTYDALQRPLELFVIDTGGKQFLAEKTEYGESKQDPEITNHRLKPWKVYDGAGVVVSDNYDFKGNLLLSERQLLPDYKVQVDWIQNPQLENETFTFRTTLDALNRPIQIITPHGAGTKLNVIQPIYNEANLLDREEVWLEQIAEPVGLIDPNTASQHAVKNIDYNAKGQREFIEYGNGVITTYKYDPLTFLLIHLQTLRGAEPLQDLFYTYDPAGNITNIHDDAQQTIYFNGQVVRPDADYTYDAVYRLIKAHGREHLGQASQPETTWNDEFRVGLAHPHDGQKMRNYFEFYTYDEVGNILLFDHKADSGNWIRTYEYNEESLIETGKRSNRLSSTTVSGATANYKYDEHGNMIRMPHFASLADPDQPNMHWDFEDQLQMVDKGGDCKVYYVYDAAGQRVRKVKEQNGTPIEERIYLGGFEIYHKYSGSDTLERETLHIIDDKQRIALVETRTQGDDGSPYQVVRYQLGNHLGSASLELNDTGQIISYEEHYPYGSTSYQAGPNFAEVTRKRYRYAGKERDEESGLYYYGARYYLPWLGRWISSDKKFRLEQPCTYEFVRSNPIVFHDPNGNEETSTANRWWGGLRVLGGGLQMVGGALVFVQVEVPVAAQVAGGVAVAHGLSDWEVGWRQMMSGRVERSIIQAGTSAVAQGLGAERPTAEAIGTGVDIGLGFVNPAGPGTGLPRLVMAEAESGEQIITVAVQASRVPQQLTQASVALHVTTGIMAMSSASGGGDDNSSNSSNSSNTSSGSSGDNGGPPPEQNYTPNPNIQPHGQQPSPRPAGMQSHHPEQQTALNRNIPNYSPNEDPALLLQTPQHRATFGPQAAQRARGAAFERELGSPAALEEAATIMEHSGVTPATAGQTTLEHSGYLFSTTPLNEVLMCLPP